MKLKADAETKKLQAQWEGLTTMEKIGIVAGGLLLFKALSR